MILGQISYLDCIVFLIFLAPQLLLRVGFLDTAVCGLKALPFLLVQMPFQLIVERFFTQKLDRTPFVQHASLFQDIVIRCVRYAFAEIPASIGKVFFSKGVALPFFNFRKLRHGVLRSPVHWEEVKRPGLQGLWLIADQSREPDIVVYYCHGGGFSMGSSYFYLEFLMAWVTILRESGYHNPALFALEYTLVPEEQYPEQVHETRRGYEFVLSAVEDSSRICVSGDSAGATLILSLLLSISEEQERLNKPPGLAVLISPWTDIVSPKNRNTSSDYLNANSLHLYGTQYIGPKASLNDPLVSPGSCKSPQKWQKASPTEGWFFVYGAEEVFAPATRGLVEILKKTDTAVGVQEEQGWIHAWPIVKLFLCDAQQERQSGIRSIVKYTRSRIS